MFCFLEVLKTKFKIMLIKYKNVSHKGKEEKMVEIYVKLQLKMANIENKTKQ